MVANDQDPIVIVSTKRTPIGDFQGGLSSLSAPQLATYCIKSILEDVSLSPKDMDEVILGCVLAAGLGQAPARQAALTAGLPQHVGCTTINKMCGSGMKAMMFAHDLLVAKGPSIMLAGGFESMSNAPYLLPKARKGYRMGHQSALDHMFVDGLEDAYESGTLMGVFAENTAAHFGFSREVQDNFALNSLEKAQTAAKEGAFETEIVPITVQNRKQSLTHRIDELPTNARPEKIPQLRPAFAKDGTVTAANSSAISDGASVHLMMRYSEAQNRHLTPLAIIKGHATHAHDPSKFTTAPIGAIQKLAQNTGWSLNDVDLFEINEAFAVVTLAAIKELNLPHEKVNVHGGACALGHPIGASGARIVTTLIHALKRRQLKRGIASLCIGGGEATAMAIEIC